jgi:hypothetical protein
VADSNGRSNRPGESVPEEGNVGLKAIEEEYNAALKEHNQTIGAFTARAMQINAKLAEYKTKLDELSKMSVPLGQAYEAAQNQVVNLNTHGIVQLDEMKKLLVLATQHAKPHSVKLEEIEQLEKECNYQIIEGTRKEVFALIKKRVGQWPAKLAVGMVFEEIKSQTIIELVDLKPDKFKVKRAEKKDYSVIQESTLAARDLKPQAYFFIRT